jgi:hypothetical protein
VTSWQARRPHGFLAEAYRERALLGHLMRDSSPDSSSSPDADPKAGADAGA